MSQASKEEMGLGLARVERDDPRLYHLAVVAGACPDAEQTFCGLSLVGLLGDGLRLVPVGAARASTHVPGRRRRSQCCRGCWDEVPRGLKWSCGTARGEVA